MDLKAEKELVERAKKDSDAFGELYEMNYQKIFKFILSKTGDVAVAQDITADTFLKALEKLWQFRWNNVPFASWLYKIASNEVNNYYRKGKTRPNSLDEMFETTQFEPAILEDAKTELIAAQEEVERHKEYLEIKKLLRNIPAKYREVVALRYLDQMKVAEIAELLQKKEGTVRALLSRGLSRLERLYYDNKLGDLTINPGK